eukprot:8336885-Alexandrium_andersonii.AAC.1
MGRDGDRDMDLAMRTRARVGSLSLAKVRAALASLPVSCMPRSCPARCCAPHVRPRGCDAGAVAWHDSTHASGTG